MNLERIDELSEKLKTYKDYHSVDEVVIDIDELIDLLQDVKKEFENLRIKFNKVVELSKENADSAEYCLRDLESKLDKIEDICKEAPALDSELSLRILEILKGN